MSLPRTVIALSLFGIVLSGCREDGSPRASLDDFRPSETLVRVNGRSYSKRQFDLDVETRLALIKHGSPQIEKKQKEIEYRMRQTVLNCMIENLLAEQHLAEKGIAASEFSITNHEARYVRQFGRRKDDAGNRETFDEIVSSIGDAKIRDNIRKTVSHEASVDTYLRQGTNALSVTESELDAIEVRMRTEDAQARETNAVIYAHATNIWLQACAGGDFAQMADQYSEEKTDGTGGDMGECNVNDFKVEAHDDGSNPVWDAIRVLKDGELTQPISSVEGLTIYKCIRRIEKSETTGLPTWHLARIVLRRALLYPPYTRAEIRFEIEKERRQRAYAAFSRELHQGAKIEFPHGVQFLPKRMRHHYTLPVTNKMEVLAK